MAKKAKETLFYTLFAPALAEWQMKTGKNQEDLAEMVGVSSAMISRYKNGRDVPRDDIKESIINAFKKGGVELSGFDPITWQQRYEYDQKYVDAIGEKLANYCDAIGLNRSFLQFLQATTDMDEGFPLYSPIVLKYSFFSDAEARRIPHAASAEMSEIKEVRFTRDGKTVPAEVTQNRIFQIHRDGKTFTFHVADLCFLKEVQTEAVRYLQYLFFKRRKEMEEENKKTMALAKTELAGGGVAYRRVSEEELRRIDRFRQYMVKAAEAENGNDNKKG